MARRDGIVVEETLSTTGDHCHRDIKGLKKSECRTCIKSAPLSDFTICPDVQASHQILADKLTEWQNSIRDAR